MTTKWAATYLGGDACDTDDEVLEKLSDYYRGRGHCSEPLMLWKGAQRRLALAWGGVGGGGDLLVTLRWINSTTRREKISAEEAGLLSYVK